MPRSGLEARVGKLIEQFCMDQMDLTQIRFGRIFFHAHAMLHGFSKMRIALHAQSRNQRDRPHILLSEMMIAIPADRDHMARQRGAQFKGLLLTFDARVQLPLP